MPKSLLISLLALSFTKDAHAYIDPGSGMLLLQGLLAAIGAAIVFIKHPIQTIKQFFSRKRDKK